MDTKEQMITYIALSLTALFWGLSFVGTKIALESFSVFTLILMRFSLASLLFFLFFLFRGFPRFSKKDHIKIIATAVFQPALYFFFETFGIEYTTASKAGIIVATIPMVVLLFSSLFFGERTNGFSIMGALLSFIGVMILVMGDPKFTWSLQGHLLGDLFMVGAVISAAAYMVMAGDLGQRYSALDITGTQMIYGTLLLLPVCLWQLPPAPLAATSVQAIVAVLFLVFLATIGAFFCYNYALSKIAASRASLFINAIPVITAIASWVILGERLNALQMGGGAIVLFAVYLTNYFTTRKVVPRMASSPSDI